MASVYAWSSPAVPGCLQWLHSLPQGLVQQTGAAAPQHGSAWPEPASAAKCGQHCAALAHERRWPADPLVAGSHAGALAPGCHWLQASAGGPMSGWCWLAGHLPAVGYADPQA